MKPKYRILFSHNTVWFYLGETIVCTYMPGSKMYYDHSSGVCEIKYAKEILQ